MQSVALELYIIVVRIARRISISARLLPGIVSLCMSAVDTKTMKNMINNTYWRAVLPRGKCIANELDSVGVRGRKDD